MNNDIRLDEASALAEASRCLYCYDAPCAKDCPAGINVPEFIARIRNGNRTAAARLIAQENVLGSVCARVCPAEELCRKQCSQTRMGKAIAIDLLQRFAMETEGWPRHSEKQEKTQRQKGKVAVIGGGPSGLAAACELSGAGVDVTVFEKENYLGGTAAWGIPPYRLPKDLLETELRSATTGMKICLEEEISAAKAEKLLQEYDYIYLAAGLGKGKKLPIEGGELAFSAEEFLAACNRGKKLPVSPGDKVAVIGGGNTALDAAVMAKQLGATQVTVLYRRTKDEMPAWPAEYMEGVRLGIEFRWLTVVKKIVRTDMGLKLHCIKMELGEKDESGRPSPVEGTESFILITDHVFSALGQMSNQEAISMFPFTSDDSGTIIWGEHGETSHPQIFAGGDMMNGGETVVRGVNDGKKAARRIIELLQDS